VVTDVREQPPVSGAPEKRRHRGCSAAGHFFVSANRIRRLDGIRGLDQRNLVAGDLYPPCTQLGGTDCNEIAAGFSSVFDVYANGTLVPGSMTFSVSGLDFDGLAFSFDNVPPGLAPYEIQYPPPYGSFFWSTESTETILFTGSASSTGTFSPSLIVLNCFSLQCGLFRSADVVCTTGPHH
jgi:hypothetical protein